LKIKLKLKYNFSQLKTIKYSPSQKEIISSGTSTSSSGKRINHSKSNWTAYQRIANYKQMPSITKNTTNKGSTRGD
jgi:hypothetical protein